MPTVDMPGKPCPECGHVIHGATSSPGMADDAVPKPGDAGICLHCGNVLVLLESGEFEKMDDEQFSSMPRDFRAEVEKVKSAIAGMRRAVPGWGESRKKAEPAPTDDDDDQW